MANPYFKHDYGVLLPARLSARMLEAYCYQTERTNDSGGLGPYEHFRRYIAMTWPGIMEESTWHPWMEWRLRTFTDPVAGVKRRLYPNQSGQSTHLFRNDVWTGCASAGKTRDAGVLSLGWWSVNPHESSVVLCSTSKNMIRRRVWPVIQKLYHEARDQKGKPIKLGHLIDSQTMLQARKGDSKHAIAAFAVEPGELQASIGKMKGMHTDRMMLVVDEADSTPPAVFELITNLRKGCREFVLMVIGNGVSMLDAHGQIAEPMAGWDSISVDSEEWETRALDKWNIEPGICLHFDGEKSPNVRAGRTKWPFIYSYEDYLSAKSKPDYAGSIQYWSFERGFWAPEGSVDRVLTPQKIIRHHARDTFVWTTQPKPCAGLDPAFGGNVCCLQFGLLGSSAEQEQCLELTDTVEIHPQAKHSMPVDNQIADRVAQECRDRDVDPGWFGLDTTGPGRSIAALLSQNWSNDFRRVEFGGAASERTVGGGDERLGKDVYGNKVSELWFQVARLVENDKLRGLSNLAAQQFCMRPYSLRGKRLVVLPKDKMKELHGKSPDHADAVAVLCDLAISKGAGGIERRANDKPWKEFRRKANEVWETPGGANDAIVQYADAE